MRVSLRNLESHVLVVVEGEPTLHHDHPGTHRLRCYR